MTKAEFVQAVVSRVNDPARAAAAIKCAEALWAALEQAGYGGWTPPRVDFEGFPAAGKPPAPAAATVRPPSLPVQISNVTGEVNALKLLAGHAEPGTFDGQISQKEAELAELMRALGGRHD